MANPLASLKHLPCPAGDSCTAFQCLFRHNRDRTENVSIGKSERQRPLNETTSVESEEEGPRKRPKLTQETSPASRDTSSLDRESGRSKEVRNVIAKSQTSDASPSGKLGAVTKPLSSQATNKSAKSPTKPAAPNSNAMQGQTRTSTAPVASSPSTPSVAKPPHQLHQPKTSVKAAPKKPETLNPRLLKKSPAQHDFRMKMVTALHEQYTRLNNEIKKDPSNKGSRLVLSAQELIVKTLDEEQEVATKKAAVYPNSMKSKIMSYKRMSAAQWKEERTKAVEEEAQPAEKPNPSEPIITGLTVPQEVEFARMLATPLTDLQRYGYITAIPTEEEIRGASEAAESSGNTEACDRCTRRFQVFPGRREEDGALASNGSCTHHPGKPYYPDRQPGDRSAGRRKYRCCQQAVGDGDTEAAAGCTTSDTHVFKTTDPKRLAGVLNFAETPPNPSVPADRAVSFDCEMGYTVRGLELIRLTAVSWPDGADLIDVLVRPVGETLDLNTRYSGVSPEDMVNVELLGPGDDPRPVFVPCSPGRNGNEGEGEEEEDVSNPPKPKPPPRRILKLVPSPRAARDLLFSVLAPSTPLIGHGTENDLNAVRVVHPTVVDTALLYPHRRGLPARNGLRQLAETHLGRRIQLEGVAGGQAQGHDSAEDARAAGDLVRLRVRDEWRRKRLEGWSVAHGDDDDGAGVRFRPPGEEDGGAWTVVGAKRKHAQTNGIGGGGGGGGGDALNN